MLSSAQLHILTQMQSGEWISGQRIAEKLGVSRTAVWKHIHKIRDYGIVIQHVSSKGYRLSEPLYFLNSKLIQEQLSRELIAIDPPIYIFSSLPSTNLYCKEHFSGLPLAICISEEQTAGKGRMGRMWNSPFAQNIYCSISFQYSDDLSKLSGLSLTVSLALRKALSTIIQKDVLQIKWPNDLHWNQRKLAGVLIEIRSEPHDASQIIIGFGININSDSKRDILSDRPYCSLRDIAHQCFDRNRIIAQCLNSLHHYMQQFFSQGFGAFIGEWQHHDALYNQEVTVHQAQQTLSGIAKGVNKAGQLLLEPPTGGLIEISSGDASLRLG